MKKIFLSILFAILISVMIPLIVVEFLKPQNNADSTLPQEAPKSTEDMQV